MPSHIDWVDRRFSFDFPAGVYPELVERLRGTPARVADRLCALPLAVVARRDGPDWSMQEHAGHLADLEALVHIRLDEYLAGAATLHAADMTNRRTWEARHNGRLLVDVLAGFRQARAQTVTRLEALPPETFGRTARHPRLDRPMRLADMLFFQAEHDDYHLARISDLVRLFGAAPG
jgi:hypothetical protein